MMSDARVLYDGGIASRISAEMPLTLDIDPYRERLGDLAMALLERRDPLSLEGVARRAVRRTWDDALSAWTREALIRMSREYEQRIAYLGDAVVELDGRGSRSHIARSVVVRLAEKLMLQAQLDVDFLDELEESLEHGVGDVGDAVVEAACGARRKLDIPAAELERATLCVLQPLSREGVLEQDPRRALRRAARMLGTAERRFETIEWAAGFVEAMRQRLPRLSEAIEGAAAESPGRNPDDDPLWLGAVRGVLLQHQLQTATSGDGSALGLSLC